MMSSSPKKLPTTNWIRRRLFALLALVSLAALPAACGRDAGTLITVYSPSMETSIPRTCRLEHRGRLAGRVLDANLHRPLARRSRAGRHPSPGDDRSHAFRKQRR